MLSFNFILGLNFISLCFWVWQCMVMSLKQREIKFKPRIKLNHNIYIYRKQQHKKGLEPGTFSSTQLHLTTTPQKLITLPWGKKLYLFHETSADKMMRTTLTELLTVKKNNVNAYSMAMNEWKNIIMLYKTQIHVLVCKAGRKHDCFVISISAVILKLMVKGSWIEIQSPP